MVVTDFLYAQRLLRNMKRSRIVLNELDDVDEVEFPDLRHEINRYDTFKNWLPSSVALTERLAAAGFYFAGQGDTVECFDCHVQLNNWQEGDDPMADHRKFSPQCRFVRKLPCGNVPLVVNPRPRSVTEMSSLQEVEYFPHLLHRAKHPEYCNYRKRLATFDTWPSTKTQTPTELAEAGFYHVGREDHVLCFYCGVALRNWEDNDIPWEAHAKWMPECFYVLSIKGHDYVLSVNSPEGIDVTEQTLELGAASHLSSNDPIPFVVSEGYDEDNVDNIRRASRVLQLREEFLMAEAKEQIGKNREVLKDKNNQEEREEELVEDTLQCKICFVQKRNILFLTCGHVVCCNSCSKMVNNVCPLCRKRIMGMVQISIV